MKHVRPTCVRCVSTHLQAEGGEPLTNVKWRQVVEKKAYRGRMWKMMGKELYLRGMWEHLSCERSKAKKFRQPADVEKQTEIQGQWQQESPAKEHLEQVKCCHDTDCNESMTKKGFTQRLFWPSFNEQLVYLLLNSSLSAQICSTRTKNTCTPREDKSSLHSHNQDGRKQKNLT